jgi:acyl-coenzyme A thioesterase PaaI-like protein
MVTAGEHQASKFLSFFQTVLGRWPLPKACMQVTSLVKHELLKDVIFLFDKLSGTAYLVVEFGSELCGHVRVVHGGMMITICDELFTAAMYALQGARMLGSGPAVCENLTLNFRKVCSGRTRVCACACWVGKSPTPRTETQLILATVQMAPCSRNEDA